MRKCISWCELNLRLHLFVHSLYTYFFHQSISLISPPFFLSNLSILQRFSYAPLCVKIHVSICSFPVFCMFQVQNFRSDRDELFVLLIFYNM